MASFCLWQFGSSRTPKVFHFQSFQHRCKFFSFLFLDTLLLDLPSHSEGENLVNFIQCHCPLNIKAKHFSLKQRVCKYIHISEFYPQIIREKTMFNILPSNNNSVYTRLYFDLDKTHHCSQISIKAAMNYWGP